MLVSEAKSVHAIRQREEKILRAAFIRFARRARAPAMVSHMMRNRTVDGIMRILKPYIMEFAAELPKAILRVARDEVKLASSHRDKLRVGKSLIFKQDDDDDLLSIDLRFDPDNERAADLLESSSLDFIDDFTRRQKRTIRRALARSMREGEGYADAARSIRSAIGLTDNQWDFVDSYRRSLEEGTVNALDRELRDRRTDARVQRAIDTGSLLDDSQIDRMVNGYTDRMIAYRANTIARTEGQRAMATGRHEAWLQMSDAMDMGDDNIVRTWNTIIDGRERDSHHDMNGQRVKGLNKPFTSGDGNKLLYPMDPAAPAEETINCLLPGSLIDAPDLLATARGAYDGQAVTIVTTAGRELSVTINHPILTTRGWMSASFVSKGDYLVAYRRPIDSPAMRSDVDTKEMPALIEKVHESGLISFPSEIMRAMNFHGDIVDGEIDIKLQAGSLVFWMQSLSVQKSSKFDFVRRNISSSLLSGDGLSIQFLLRAFHPAYRCVGRRNLVLPLLFAHLRPFNAFLLSLRAYPYAVFREDAVDESSLLYTKVLGECLDRASPLVELDQVVGVRTYPFRAHVYSPQTLSGMYLAQGVLQHNCRCVETYDVDFG